MSNIGAWATQGRQRRGMGKVSKKLCFAVSSGGHFEQISMLKPLMEKYDSFVVTEETAYGG